MARSIVTTGDEVKNTSFGGVAASGTVSIWLNPNWNSGDSVKHVFWYFGNDTDNSPAFQRYLDNNIYVGFQNSGGAGSRIVVNDPGLFTSGTWASWIYTWSGSAQGLYKNGSSVGSGGAADTSALGDPGYWIGEYGDGSGVSSDGCNSSIAEFAYWSVVLDAAEIAALAKGYSPFFIRPASLGLYLPLMGRTSPEIERIGGFAGTLTGTSVAPHTRIIMPRGRQVKRYRPVVVANIYVYMRPDADQSDGSWLNELGTNVDLYASVDETVASDADYIQSSTTSGDKVRLRLSNPGAAVAEPFAIRYRASATTGTASLYGRLYQGASTLIDSWNHTVDTTPTDYTHTLGTTEFSSISDFDDLFIEFEYTP